jgi:putative ABC transport system permease protein
MSRHRFFAVFLSIFAGLAVVLAAVGIYGLVSFAVERRTREVGIRMALGASRSQVTVLVLRRMLGLTFAGILLGVASAAAGTRYLESLLFGLTPLDVPVFVSVCLVFAAAATLAAAIPARRAARVDPMVSLRCE